MNGMLSRASGNSQPLLNLQIAQANKRQIFQGFKGGVGQQHQLQQHVLWPGQLLGVEPCEPTSVLDIRSPSPTSTLSSSVAGAGATAGGGASSVESGAPPSVSALLCETLSDNGNNTTNANTNTICSSANATNNTGAVSGHVNNGHDVKREAEAEEWSHGHGATGMGMGMGMGMGVGGGAGAGHTVVMEDLDSILMESSGCPDQTLMRYLLGEAAPADEPVPPSHHMPSAGMFLDTAHTQSCFPSFEHNSGISNATANHHLFPALPPLCDIPAQQAPSAFIPEPPPPPPPPPPPQQPHMFYTYQQQQQQQQQQHLFHSQQQQQQQMPSMYMQVSSVRAPAAPPMLVKPPGPPAAAAVEQLVRAAECVEEGSIGQAQAILARLNQHLTPLGKPLQRAAYYFKESLAALVRNDIPRNSSSLSSSLSSSSRSSSSSASSAAADTVQRIGAYKAFAEASPLAQFGNLTVTQSVLEACDGAGMVHVVDLDLGLGGHWAPLLQELAMRTSGAPAVRLTALGPACAETFLAADNLKLFAKHLNIPFEFSASPDYSPTKAAAAAAAAAAPPPTPTPTPTSAQQEQCIVVLTQAAVRRLGPPEAFVRLLRDLAPRAVIFIDSEPLSGSASAGGPSNVAGSFAGAFYEALQFYAFVFDSLDAVNMGADGIARVEKYVLAPKIEAAVVGAARAEQRPPWRVLMTMLGMCPAPPSNFTETQAEYLARRPHARGFHVIKSQASLLLAWQGRPLVSATAWRFAGAGAGATAGRLA